MTEKKIKGRKRHIVTDTLGNLLCVCVHAANIHVESLLLERLYTAIQRSLLLVQIKGIGEHLKTPLKSFIISGSTFLQEFKIRLKFNRFVRRLNGLCHGFRALAVFQKTMRSKRSTLKLCV